MKTANGYWVLSGPALPAGARRLDDAGLGDPPPGRTWLDVCILGQHLPQMYPDREIRELTAGECPRLGLCPDCLGFGDVGTLRRGADDPRSRVRWLARGIDEVRDRCPNCGGSGRPALRITVTRGPGGTVIEGAIRSLPHAYVPPMAADPNMLALFEIPDGMCLACGMPPTGDGPDGKPLHTVPDVP